MIRRQAVFKLFLALTFFSLTYISLGVVASFVYLLWPSYDKEEVIGAHARGENVLYAHLEGEFSTFGSPFGVTGREVKYKINSLGLRNPEISKAKTPGTFRILVLGDSMTYGAGAKQEAVFTRLLEDKLNQDAGLGKDIEVINAGNPGSNPLGQLKLYEEKLTDVEFDLVLWVIFSNDWMFDQYFWTRFSYFEKKLSQYFLPIFYSLVVKNHRVLGIDMNPFASIPWKDMEQKHSKRRSYFEAVNVIEPMKAFKQSYSEIDVIPVIIDSPIIETKTFSFASIGSYLIDISREIDFNKLEEIKPYVVEPGVDHHLNEQGHKRVGQIIYTQLAPYLLEITE